MTTTPLEDLQSLRKHAQDRLAAARAQFLLGADRWVEVPLDRLAELMEAEEAARIWDRVAHVRATHGGALSGAVVTVRLEIVCERAAYDEPAPRLGNLLEERGRLRRQACLRFLRDTKTLMDVIAAYARADAQT